MKLFIGPTLVSLRHWNCQADVQGIKVIDKFAKDNAKVTHLRRYFVGGGNVFLEKRKGSNTTTRFPKNLAINF